MPFFKAALLAGTVAAAWLLGAGCGLLGRRPEPFPSVGRVAVAPVLISGMVEAGMDERLRPFGQVLSNELVRLDRFQVLRPSAVEEVQRIYKLKLASARDALAIGKQLKADVIVVSEITDYSPYPPARVSIAVQVFATDPDRYVTEGSYVELSQSGRPFRIEGALDQRPIIAFETVVDASDDWAEERLGRFMQARADRPMGRQAYLMLSKGFLRFAAFNVVDEIVRREVQRRMQIQDAEVVRGAGHLPAAYRP